MTDDEVRERLRRREKLHAEMLAYIVAKVQASEMSDSEASTRIAFMTDRLQAGRDLYEARLCRDRQAGHHTRPVAERQD